MKVEEDVVGSTIFDKIRRNGRWDAMYMHQTLEPITNSERQDIVWTRS